jgi:hypothetical protein
MTSLLDPHYFLGDNILNERIAEVNSSHQHCVWLSLFYLSNVHLFKYRLT